MVRKHAIRTPVLCDAYPVKAQFLAKRYDKLEIHPLLSGLSDDGTRWYEPCEHHEAEIWSVYGHIPNAGCDCIGDFATRDMARAYAVAISMTYQLPITFIG